MNKIQYTVFTLFLICLMPIIGRAQSKVTFRIDMRYQITGGAFIPGNSTVAVSGNQLPFSKTRMIKLKDEVPKDSIYTATIHFPSLTNGRELTYQYIIKQDYEIREQNYRFYGITSKNNVLPVVKFNEFVR